VKQYATPNTETQMNPPAKGRLKPAHQRRWCLAFRRLGPVLLIAFFATCNLLFAQDQNQPNVVVIFADDLGYGDVGCYGATKVQTPNIDRLATQGRRFTDAHSASAVCTPSRYALLTGEYPFRRGLSYPVFLKTGLVIDPNRLTIAKLMKQAGYATACIGKWHLGFGVGAPEWNGQLKPGPLEVGFDHYFGVPVVNSHPPFVYVENHQVVGVVPDDPFVFGKKSTTEVFPEKMGIDQIGGAEAAHALYKDRMVGTRLTEKSVQWIKQHRDQPFFLYFATTNIHHPFTPHPRFQGTSQCGRYGDFVHELDWIVGEVMNTLEEQGLADNTLLIFTSDNGGMINQGGQAAWKDGHRQNGHLLGFKFDAWEGGHRVPFIARWPGKIEANSVSQQLISNVDILGTLAAITGQAVPEGEGPDSVNVLPALTGNPQQPIRDHLVLAASRSKHLALRSGKWVYINGKGGGGFTGSKVGTHLFGGPAALKFAGQPNSDVVDGKFKPDAPADQLYDLTSDPSQSTNVVRENPDLARRMRKKLAELQK
jgi:arylsulfatase A